MPRPKTKAQDIRNPEHYFNRTIALEIKHDQIKRRKISQHECSLEEQMEFAGFEAKYLSCSGEYEDLVEVLCDHDNLLWIESIKDPGLYEIVMSLSMEHKKILTMLVFEGLSQREIAQRLGVCQNAIFKKIKIIKSIFQKGWSTR